MWLLRGLTHWLPRLQAEESLRAATVAVMPIYALSKKGAKVMQRIQCAWRRIAAAVHAGDPNYSAAGEQLLRGSAGVRSWLAGIGWTNTA